MSTETPPEEKKKPFYRRILPSTLAGQTALATALVLWIVLIVVWVLRLFGDQSIRLSHSMTALRIVIELALVIAIPIVLYLGIRRWNQVIEGAYPDIDRAWEAGINALEAQGISPGDYPVFLILGSSGSEVEHGLMDSLESKLTVHGIPDATGVSHPLQWYVSSDAIYLFCPGASSLSALMGRWTTPTTQSRMPRPVATRTPEPKQEGDGTVGSVLKPGTPTGSATPAPAGLPKIQAAPAATPSKPQPLPPKESALRPAAAKPEQDGYLGTIQFDQGAGESLTPTRGAPFSMPTPQAPAVQPPSIQPPATPNPISQAPAMPTAPAAPSPSDAMRPAPRYEGTIASFDQVPPAPAPSQSSGNGTSTISPAAPVAGQSSGASQSPGAPSRTAAPNVTPPEETPAAASSTKPKPPAPSAPLARTSSGQIALPASLDTSDQIPRLRYVCKLLRRVRRPACGINGTVTLLPFELSRVGPLQLAAIAQSARGDIGVIQETLGVRCPVTAVLVGLEQDKGFIELVRRLQAGLLSRRLGGRFDLRSRPTPEELNTHSDRLCDAFEDWVYRLFGREDGLSQQRGNRKLYALISKIRHELKPRLRMVLGQAFGCESSDGKKTGEADQSFFFSGCYFVASGATTGQPAFVKGVLKDKLLDEQSQVEWTQESLRRHKLFQLFVILGWIATAILAVFLLSTLFSA